PGVMEKLGLGPDQCWQKNPAIVYGRVTGWGQDGPLAHAAGHDINYLAITGALHAMGVKGAVPTPPLNLVGDYGAGLFLAFGLLCAILSSRQSGVGQIVDSAMVDGVNTLMSLFHSLSASDMWVKERSSNFLDGGAPYYRCYETQDEKFISLGAIERPFMRIFAEAVGIDEAVLNGHINPSLWPELSEQLETLFRQRSQHEWCKLLEGSDACFAPVIPFWEAHKHSHNRSRKNFITVDGLRQPAPAPRFSHTPAKVTQGPVKPGADTQTLLTELGYDEQQISLLRAEGAAR
ncbi:MAG: CoA transferase, partial [Spongiibacteraceae bacterium]|nr:CoA transferase [Spongiibacteraceae bacterium]